MKVLVVDDSFLIRLQLQKFFEEEMGFEVITAEDGDDALYSFKEDNPDLVTLDITMPQKDGLQVLREIMEMDPKAKIIMISAFIDSEKINEAYQNGAQGYIKKPLKLKHSEYVNNLKEEVRSALI